MRATPSSLHDDVASQLRAYIFDGQLRPGNFIDEVTLCELWSISRTPLREALKVLTAEGLLRHEPRRGCFVNEVTEQDLDDIFPVIALLEGRCAFDATQRANIADVQTLELLHQRLQQHADAGRINDYYDTNFAIHEAIIQLANNKWLAHLCHTRLEAPPSNTYQNQAKQQTPQKVRHTAKDWLLGNRK